MWSAEVAQLFADALADNPELHLVVVVPRVPDQEGAFAEWPQKVGRWQAIEMCRRAGRNRVHVFDVENQEGTPVYVHAKVCVVDDTWASVGSDNFNRRSWTHDSELSSAVLDTTRDEREPTDPRGTGEGVWVYGQGRVGAAAARGPGGGGKTYTRRSWTHDSELSSAVLDTTRDEREPTDPRGTGEGARTFARDLRLRLAREHLDLPDD